MRIQRVVVIAALVGAMLHGTPADAVERITIDCSNTIDAPGSYIVRNAVRQCSSTMIIEIEASDVTLDLNGNTLDGELGVCGAGVRVTGVRTNVKVRNGTVRDCGNGIVLDDDVTGSVVSNIFANSNTTDGIHVEDGNRVVNNVTTRNENQGIDSDDNNIIENNVSSGNDSDGIVSHDGSVIRNNVTHGNGNFGIAAIGEPRILSNDVRGNAHGIFFTTAVIKNNIVEGNEGVGIQQLSSGDALLERNTIRGNGIGVTLMSDATVAENKITGNVTSGLQGSSDNVVRDNLVNGNGHHGMLLSDTGNTIVRNQASRNAESGIFVAVGSPSTTIKNNTTNDNGDLGIDAEPGVLGTGTNHASGNLGGPPQCDPSDLCV